MAYVSVPKDLTKVKSKVLFNLTKRQLLCFGIAAAIGLPLFFLLKDSTGTTVAAMVMIFAMLPGFMFGVYEKNGQPLEVIGRHIIESCFIRPKERPYQTNNAYAALVRQHQMEKEVKAIVQSSKARSGAKRSGKNKADIHHHTVCCHTVLTGVGQQLNVVEHSYHIHGNIAHKLGRAVDTGLYKRRCFKVGLTQPQNGRILSAEV